MATNSAPTKKNDELKKKPSLALPVQASFVFVDSLNHPIKGLTVKIDSSEQMKSETISVSTDSASTQSPPSFPYVGKTDDDGHAVTLSTVKRGQKISIFVKKRNGNFDFKGEVTPKRDINAYTIKSPEFHLESTTKLTPKEALEEELNIPKIKVGEVMTVERLFGELAPYIGAVQVVTEVGSITKDFPTKKTTLVLNEKTGKQEKKIEIEHHYKVVKTDKPRTIAMNVLGSKLNYPKTEISEDQFKEIAEKLGCEVAAVKAVTYTEAGGGGYLSNGLPKILFERHKFYQFTKPAKGIHPYDKFPDICNPNAGGYKGELGEYERLIKAAKFDKEAAIKSCSWGAFQVLAEYYSQMGYSSASALANECMESIDAQINIFIQFLTKLPEKKPAINALKERDWETFTRYYNGKNWPKSNPDYPRKMASNYAKF